MKLHLYHFLCFINKPYRIIWALISPEVYLLQTKQLLKLCQKQEVRKLTVIERREKRHLEWLVGVKGHIDFRWMATSQAGYMRICRIPKAAAELLKQVKAGKWKQ